MTIHAALRHITRYRYDRAVRMGPQVVRLRPAPHSRTPILAYNLTISPEPHFLNWQQDPQSNWLARIVFPDPVDHFEVQVDLTAALEVINPFDFFLEPEAERSPFDYDSEVAEALRPYRAKPPSSPLFDAYVKRIDLSEKPTTAFIFDLNARLSQQIRYLIRMEPGIQTPEETLEKGEGSCRDSAWLLVQIMRHLGLAARFVSGYLIQLKADQKPLDGPAGTDIDFTDLHAWAEVFLPGAGWVGLDATSGLFAGEGHIPLAATAVPSHAAPVSGAMEPCEVSFEFEMSVERVLETPRVTRPYEPVVWQRIEDLGGEVDAILQDEDVRLTMGGEPTFVALDDPDADEWNTAAVGPTKRAYADRLVRRLRERFAPGGMLHYGQGKWYPGESLPRWAFGLYWRGDGKPLWHRAELVAEEARDGKPTAEQARALTEGIARRLDLSPDYVQAAYEDPSHYLRREAALPDNVDPFDSKLADPEERARIARVFKRGLDKPAGFVLPLQRWNAADGRPWLSELWQVRMGRLLLVPGDSPVGFRLPLDSLPYLSPEDYPQVIPDDPFEERPPLPADVSHRQPFLAGQIKSKSWRERVKQVEQPQPGEGTAVRTALAVEPRDGRLTIFLPPVENAEDYLDLVAAIEDAAAEQKLPLHIEGYTPPPDPRLNVIKVTPDPGVIEVNIHPSPDWPQQVEVTKAVYEEARACRLGTEKFQIDGRPAGTGGGNHIVVGGATPADSPFLRRPDLLRSLVTYWQNHPALSYLFSGLFIGPTSQSPRIDEARHDALYELEIAFRQVPEPHSGAIAPWLVDRLFRNLLIDVTGNTHRAEICIDKLYSPDGPAGRLGLVEFRGFEMPPHPEMSLAQSLLIRALIARFWRTPYRQDLVRWGTQLHDRFMLPHFIWADLESIVADLGDHGFPLQAEWFRPHWEFRFPKHGQRQLGDLSLELRQALEPWHVMGEEGAIGGTVRFVDSSVERMELKLRGMTEKRHRLLVNGIAAPLAPTGQQGEAVVGLRFRTWHPAHCLHPTIGPHDPLILEVWDAWRERSLGGCTYHVSHPGGRNHTTRPVNGNEAEGRRLARFQPFGYTGGRFQPEPPKPDPEFPLTLDLRRFS